MEKRLQRIKEVVAMNAGQYRTMLLEEIDQLIEEKEVKLKAYIHTGHGHWIGSSVVVLAETKRKAVTMVKKELIAMGLPDEKVEDLQELELKPGTIYSYNGDY